MNKRSEMSETERARKNKSAIYGSWFVKRDNDFRKMINLKEKKRTELL